MIWLSIPIVFITGGRFRKAYQLADVFVQHQKALIGLTGFGLCLGVGFQLMHWPDWLGAIIIILIAGVITWHWYQEAAHD